MTSTLDRAGARTLPDVVPIGPAAGLFAAVQAATAGLVVVAVPVVVSWLSGAAGDTGWRDVACMTVALWLLAHHVALAVGGGQLSLVPLGLVLVPALACAFAGARLARSLDPNAERIAAGTSRSTPRPAPRTALIAMAAGYAVIATALAALTPTAFARPVIWQAPIGTFLIALAGGWVGSLHSVHAWADDGRGRVGAALDGVRAVTAAALAQLPDGVRRYLGPLAAAATVWLGGAAVAVLVAMLFGAGRMLDLYQALGGGVAGAAMITVLQLVLLPNLLVWTGAALAGPGFSVGAGTLVSPQGCTLGPLPAVPFLGALPPPGPMPAVTIAVIVVPVLAGAVAAHRLLAVPALGVRLGTLLDVAALAAGAGLGAGLLAWLSSGSAGPGRLAVVGPAPWWVALAVAAEVGVGAGAMMLVRRAAPAAADALAAGRYRRGM